MDFGTALLNNLSDPKPSYEFTRAALVSSINDYVRESLASNVYNVSFGVTGVIEYPTGSSVPYFSFPGKSVFNGTVTSFYAGTVSETEYDSVAALSRESRDLSTFWSGFFELIGRCILRSTLTIVPYQSHTSVGYASSVSYTSESLTAGSMYNSIGTPFNVAIPLTEWRSKGEIFASQIKQMSIMDRDSLWNMASSYIRDAATASTNLYRLYVGTIRRDNDPEPGILNGYIYGSLIFE